MLQGVTSAVTTVADGAVGVTKVWYAMPAMSSQHATIHGITVAFATAYTIIPALMLFCQERRLAPQVIRCR